MDAHANRRHGSAVWGGILGLSPVDLEEVKEDQEPRGGHFWKFAQTRPRGG